MSLDLKVERLADQTSIAGLLRALRTALEELVGEKLPEGITVSLVKTEVGRPTPFQPDDIEAEWYGRIFLNGKHGLELMAFRLSDTIKEVGGNDPMRPEYFDLNASISLSGAGEDGPLLWLWWAASAIALARVSCSNVIDDHFCWSQVYEQEPEAFLATVKAAKPPAFIEQARQELRQMAQAHP